MKMKLARVLTAALILCLPSMFVGTLLKLMGHRVGRGCRFGFSLVLADGLLLNDRVKIGHFNFLKIRRLVMCDDAYIGRMNIIHGPLDVILGKRSFIGNANKITRGIQDVVAVGRCALRLGYLSAITANHRIDCTTGIRLGDFTTVAGIGSQIWTHGYIHDTEGPGRYRIDGKVEIGNNVYIGAGCIVSMGVRIASGAIVGAGVTVARNFDEPGLYVSAAVRQLPRPVSPDQRADLVQVSDARLCERVYIKIKK